MPDAIITSTASTFGTISGTFAADQSTITGTVTGIVAGTLSGSVGVPGPQGPTGATGATGATGPTGPAGSPGVGVPVGGTAGQFLTKIDSTNYNTDWTTVNLSVYAVKANNLSDLPSAPTARTNLGLGSLAVVNDAPSDGSQYARKNGAWDVVSASAFITSVSSPLAVTTGNLTVDLSAYLTSATAASTYQTLAGMSSYLTTATAASTYYLQTNPSGFQTAADVTTALSPYLLSATAASTYAVIAAGQPVAGSTGQVLTKQSGTNYDSIWVTPVVGDRYLTSSTTSNTVSNGNKTFTIGTGLSYTPTQNITISYDASNHMHGEVLTYNSGTGVLTVDINNHTGSGTYASWVVNVGGVTPATSVAWGAITGTLSAQTDLQSALDLKLAATTAATTYYPLVGNPSSFLVAADITGKADLASPTFSGTPSLPTGTIGVTQTAGDSTTALATTAFVTTADNLKANIASPALTGNVSITSNSATAALTITQDGAGDILRLNDVSGDTTFTFVDAAGKVNTIASTTASAGLNVPHGAAPTSPVNGDIWTTTSGLFARINAGTQQFAALSTNNTFSNASSTYGNSTAAGTINLASGATISGATKAVNIGTAGVSGSTTNITVGPVLGASTTSIGNTTAASTLNLATGATLTATTKAVNIGTAGVAGSTTTIAIGSTTGTSTTTLQGTTNGITAAVDTNSVALATTAYVVGQAASATPLVNGTAAVGTSLRYARADHVHGTDTTRAALASPTFTGTPTLPTGTIGVTQSPGNNTTALATTAFVTAAVPAFATETQAIVGTSSTTTISPLTMRHILSNAGYTAHTSLVGNYSSYVSGSASVSALWSNLVGLSVTAANGKVAFLPNSFVSYFPFTSRGKAELNLDWTKPIWFSFRFNYSSAAGIGDSNTVNRVTIGKLSSVFGDLTNKGFGVTWTAGTTGAFTVSAHNGTTLTSLASAVTVSNTTYFPTTSAAADFLVYSDGTGNITLFCNGVQVATTTGGPSSGNLVGGRYTFEADNTTSTSGNVLCDYTGIRSMYSY